MLLSSHRSLHSLGFDWLKLYESPADFDRIPKSSSYPMALANGLLMGKPYRPDNPSSVNAPLRAT